MRIAPLLFFIKKNIVPFFCILAIIFIEATHFFSSGLPRLTPDSFTYLRLSEEIQKGHFYIDQWGSGSISTPLLYPILLALFQKIILDPFISGAILSLFFSAATIFIAYALAKEAFERLTANITVVLLIINPFYTFYSSAILTEALFAFLFTLTFYFIYKIPRNRSNKLSIYCFAAGTASALICHTRDAGIVIAILSFFWLTYFLNKRRILTLTIVKYLLIFIIGFALFFVPLKILSETNQNLDSYNNTVKRNILKILIAPNFGDITREIGIRTLNSDGTNYRIVTEWLQPVSLIDVFSKFDWVLKKFSLNVGKILLYLLVITGVILGLFAAFSFIIHWRNKNNKILMFLFLSFIALYSLFYASAGSFTGAIHPKRYLFPILPLLMILTGSGVTMLFESALKQTKETRRTIKPFFYIIAFSVAIFIIIQTSANKQDYKYAQEILQYQNIAKHFDLLKVDQSTIMARNPILPYLTKSSFVLTPYADYGDIIRFAKMMDVNYFFLEKDLIIPDSLVSINNIQSKGDFTKIISTDMGALYKINK